MKDGGRLDTDETETVVETDQFFSLWRKRLGREGVDSACIAGAGAAPGARAN
jgi:hypothetical protein